MAQAVDEVAAKGVAYFSSAGNRPATQAYDSSVRIVPGNSSSWAGDEPELRERSSGAVRRRLPQLQDRRERVDIAQTVQFANNSTLVFQWNEPFDPVPPTPVGDPIVSGTGTVPLNGVTSFTFRARPGSSSRSSSMQTPTTGTPHPDLTMLLIDPNGDEIQFVDTTTNPESLTLELPLSGTYTVDGGELRAGAVR